MNICPECGRPRNARMEASDCRALLTILVAKYGSLNAAANAFAERHDMKPETVRRRFQRLRTQRGVYTTEFRDNLEVLL